MYHFCSSSNYNKRWASDGLSCFRYDISRSVFGFVEIDKELYWEMMSSPNYYYCRAAIAPLFETTDIHDAVNTVWSIDVCGLLANNNSKCSSNVVCLELNAFENTAQLSSHIFHVSITNSGLVFIDKINGLFKANTFLSLVAPFCCWKVAGIQFRSCRQFILIKCIWANAKLTRRQSSSFFFHFQN